MSHYDLESRVPMSGAPAPEWISEPKFKEQLIKVHGSVPDPKIGLFGPKSMMWKVGKHTLLTPFSAGRALLLQVAHPWITVGIDHHSLTRDDPLGRAHRTFTNVLAMNFGSLDQAFEAARRVHIRHAGVHGRLDYDAGAFLAGTKYKANEANAMVWVHSTLWETLMNSYELLVHEVSPEEKERYYQETKLFAYLFGIPEQALPPDWPTFVEYNRRMWESDLLKVTPASRELTKFLFSPLHPALGPAMHAVETITAATLPERLRRDFGLRYDGVTRAEFKALVAALQVLERTLPPKVRYVPTYFEAVDRIRGRKPDPMTRALTRAALGQWELVA